MRSKRSCDFNLEGLILGIDLLAVVAAYSATLYILFESGLGRRLGALLNLARSAAGIAPAEAGDLFFAIEPTTFILGLGGLLLLLYAFMEDDRKRLFLIRRGSTIGVLKANLYALLLIYGYLYLQRITSHPRSAFAVLILLNAVFCIGFRALYFNALRWLRCRFRLDEMPALLIGDTDEADFICELIRERRPHNITIRARLQRAADEDDKSLLARIEQAASEHRVRMIICADKDLALTEIMSLLELAGHLRLSAKVLSNHLSVVTGPARMPADMIGGTSLVHFGCPEKSRLLRITKRVCSFLLALVLLVLLFPLMLLIALVISLSSKGPPIYVQERIGFNRQPFKMLKFRTMFEKADELQHAVELMNDGDRTLFKIRRDPRVTPVGRILRRFSLDEIPQLLNVLKGDMTIIGPRPLPVRDFQNYFEDWHYFRHEGLPGLSCLWQISGRSSIKFRDMCILDTYYLCNMTFWLDMRILFRTLGAVLIPRGAY